MITFIIIIAIAIVGVGAALLSLRSNKKEIDEAEEPARKGMRAIHLYILKEDLETASWWNSSDCPITRAFKRAGYPNIRHQGVDMHDDKTGESVRFPTKIGYEVARRMKDTRAYEKDARRPEDLNFIVQIPAHW